MVAAGCEGGSWSGVEENTGLWHYLQMQRHWERFGPPVYMSVAAYLGHKAPDGDKSSSSNVLNAAEHLSEIASLMEAANG
jgi:hypothetical protein